MEEKIVRIVNEMAEVLDASQLRKLQEVLLKELCRESCLEKATTNEEYLQMFLNAKKIEGCSERTIQYYHVTVERFLKVVQKRIRKVTAEEIRQYLVEYQSVNNCSKTTMDNICRNISSFFSKSAVKTYIDSSAIDRLLQNYFIYNKKDQDLRKEMV